MNFDANLILNGLTAGILGLLAYLNHKSRADAAEREVKNIRDVSEHRDAIRTLIETTRQKFSDAIETMRVEIAKGFLPVPLAQEQREQVIFRLTVVEEELKGIRVRLHQCANDVSQANALMERLLTLERTVHELSKSMK